MTIRLLLFFFLLVSACSSRIEYAVHDPAPVSASASININTASVTELERLPYIGRTTAEAIVAFRRDHGPFRRPEQLMLIRGISERRFMEVHHLIDTK